MEQFVGAALTLTLKGRKEVGEAVQNKVALSYGESE